MEEPFTGNMRYFNQNFRSSSMNWVYINNKSIYAPMYTARLFYEYLFLVLYNVPKFFEHKVTRNITSIDSFNVTVREQRSNDKECI